LLIVALLALAVRGGFVAARYEQLSADPDGYRAIAQELRTTGTFARRYEERPAFPTAYRPSLYPLLLAAVGTGRFAIASLHVVLGTATVVGTFLLARRLGLTRGAWEAAL
jgi:hypothetical protein